MCNILTYFYNIDIKHLQHILKHLKHLKHMLAIYAFNAMSPCCLDKWRLIVAELDTGAEVGGGAELAGAAAARATHRWDDITRSSSPCLFAGASVVESGQCSGGARDGQS
jgi:hypothetical protein